MSDYTDVDVKLQEVDQERYHYIVRLAHRGELGLSILAAELFGNEIVFDHTEGQWYSFQAGYWQADANKGVRLNVAGRLLKLLTDVESYFYQKEGADSTNAAVANSAKSTMKNRYGIASVLDLTSSQLGITSDMWDVDPYLLGCINGIIDLKTGDLREAKPSDYIRKVIPVEYKGQEEPCPRFTQFMNEIFNDDTDLVYFMCRLLGYCVTGSTDDHILPILWGEDGRNGKSVLLRILSEILDGYASPVPAEVLLSAMNNPGAASPNVMLLQGLRLGYINETNEGFFLDSGTTKWLTGGDKLIGRPLYGKPVSFDPTHKNLLVSNYKPHVNADDSAIWERILLIPFVMRFIDEPTEPNERKRDPKLLDKLRQEKSGILSWLVRGAIAWQTVGLMPPSSVTMITESYRQDEDILGQFIEMLCVLDDEAKIKASQLYKNYRTWAKDAGFKPLTETTFGKRMGKRFEKQRFNDGMYYLGLKLDLLQALENMSQ